jgi:hypothetical protein
MVQEYEQKLYEALSVEKRVKDYETVHERIENLGDMLDQVNFEREQQINSMGGVLKMINVAGNMVPDRVERGTQSDWHFPIISSHIFTEIDGETIHRCLTSNMQQLVYVSKYMPDSRAKQKTLNKLAELAGSSSKKKKDKEET